MTQYIHVHRIEGSKVYLRYGDLEWSAKPGDAIRIGTPDLGIYEIKEDGQGGLYQGPVKLPRPLTEEELA
jgi:hypothetical protein